MWRVEEIGRFCSSRGTEIENAIALRRWRVVVSENARVCAV
ncbi:hypothetical protein Rcae01_01801 [Novipirellula caenicola]|uniref:Uncharacterized protein n=1 Tax=Novipirellula caenicola TaxID=1536901 RepID=A0ABP9VMD0_9BACT